MPGCRGGVPIVPMVTRENCMEAVAKISRQRRVKISWQRINFSAEERAAEERGQAAPMRRTASFLLKYIS